MSTTTSDNAPSTVLEEADCLVAEEKPRFEIGCKIAKIFEQDNDGFKICFATLKCLEEIDGEKDMCYLVEYDDKEEEHLTEKEVERLIRNEKNGMLEKTLKDLNHTTPLEPPIPLETKIKLLVQDQEEFDKTGISTKKLLHGKLVSYGPVSSRLGVEILFEVLYDNGDREHLSEKQVYNRLRSMKHHGMERRLKDYNFLKTKPVRRDQGTEKGGQVHVVSVNDDSWTGRLGRKCKAAPKVYDSGSDFYSSDDDEEEEESVSYSSDDESDAEPMVKDSTVKKKAKKQAGSTAASKKASASAKPRTGKNTKTKSTATKKKRGTSDSSHVSKSAKKQKGVVEQQQKQNDAEKKVET